MDKVRPRHGQMYINQFDKNIEIWDDYRGEWLKLTGEEILDRKYKRPLGSQKYYPKYPQPDLLCEGCNLPYYDCLCKTEEEELPFDLTLEDELFEI
jgi:hypothetical protein